MLERLGALFSCVYARIHTCTCHTKKIVHIKLFAFELAGQESQPSQFPVQIRRLGKFHVKSKRQLTGNQLGSVSLPAKSNANSITYFCVPVQKYAKQDRLLHVLRLLHVHILDHRKSYMLTFLITEVTCSRS